MTKPASNTSELPAISVSAAATSPPVQLSATAIRRPAARFASITCARPCRPARAGGRSRASRSSILRQSDRRDGLGGDAFAAAGEAEPLGRRRLDANPPTRQPQQRGDPRAHGVAMRADLRRLADDRDVDMVDPAARLLDQGAGMLDEQRRGGAAPLRVGGREMVADIARADRAEQRVGDRVERDVGVAMAREALVVRDADAAEPERLARGEARGRRSRSRRGRERRAASAAREIGLVGELFERRVALDDRDVEPRGAGDLRVVGRLASGPGRVGARGSRRSGRPAESAPGADRSRVDRRRRRRRDQGVDDRQRRDRASCRPSAASSRSITVAGREGARGVVDQDVRSAIARAPRARCAPTAAASRRRASGEGRARRPIASR